MGNVRISQAFWAFPVAACRRAQVSEAIDFSDI
jgi:hypothetical protein